MIQGRKSARVKLCVKSPYAGIYQTRHNNAAATIKQLEQIISKYHGSYALKIYTKTGDDGTTGLQGGSRVSKSSQRIAAYGCMDEVNSVLGVISSYELDDDISEIIQNLQKEIFVAGADLSNPNMNDKKNRITSDMTGRLETTIDKFEENLEPLTRFVLPGGDRVAALLHLARTITRRAETHIVALEQDVNESCKTYVNRLSDLLFVMARTVNKRRDIPDTLWNA